VRWEVVSKPAVRRVFAARFCRFDDAMQEQRT